MQSRLFLNMAAATVLSLTAGTQAMAETANSQIHYAGDAQPSFTGPAELFTGEVQVKRAFPANEIAHYSGAYVRFAPGARSAWHHHPAGQHIVVTEGTALTGTRDGKAIAFAQGEAIWCPPELDHWHGATPDAAMTHFVVTASKAGENVVWKEKVSEQEYEEVVAAAKR